jgi:hypothetical protein
VVRQKINLDYYGAEETDSYVKHAATLGEAERLLPELHRRVSTIGSRIVFVGKMMLKMSLESGIDIKAR